MRVKHSGKARMADISAKAPTFRVAVAEGRVLLSGRAWEMIRKGELPKGDALGVAVVAGIQAAKATPQILPLCHPIPLSSVRVDVEPGAKGEIRILAEVRTTASTGVEMEALVAVAAAALCVYDMAKPVDRGIEISGVRLVRKTGGKSGDYARGSSLASREASREASRPSRPESGKGPKRSL